MSNGQVSETTAAVMFGTCVVSCLYADRWMHERGEQEPIVGFIAGAQDRELEVFRPGSTIIRNKAHLKDLCDNRTLKVICPDYRRQDLTSWSHLNNGLLQAAEVVILPTPPDYVIEWIPFSGDTHKALEFCEGYDAVGPTTHAVETQQQRLQDEDTNLTQAQMRQGLLIETCAKTLKRPLRVVDFGGACGGHFFTLTAQQRQLVESWTVIETEEMVAQAQNAFFENKLSFVHSVADIRVDADLVLASSSLQYVFDFEHQLNALLELKSNFFCIDRTPMDNVETEEQDEPRVFLQRVFRNHGNWQYETSYPMFLHAKERYVNLLSKNYALPINIQLQDEAVVSKEGREAYYFMVGSRLLE